MCFGGAGVQPADEGGGRVVRRAVRLPGGDATWPVVTAPIDTNQLKAALDLLGRGGQPAKGRQPGKGGQAVLVVDNSPSMAVWAETIDEFEAVALRSEAIAGVRRWSLSPGARSPVTEPDTADDRTILFVFTDGAAPAWSSGAMTRSLRGWGARHPLAIIHLLPQTMWRRTGLVGDRLRLLYAGASRANTSLGWRPLDATIAAEEPAAVLSPGPAEAVPVPLLELDPQWIRAWLRLVSGHGKGADLPCLLAPITLPEAPATPSPARSTDATAFRAVASPESFELATYLAAAPLNIAVMRLVQAETMPHSRPEHLAEILVAGLVRPVRPDPAADRTGLITHDFPPGVRAELLAAARRASTTRVVRVVDLHLGAHVPAVRRLARSVEDPTAPGLDRLDAGERWFVEIQATVLQALSGRYLPLAGRIQGLVAPATGREPPAHTTGAANQPVEVGMSPQESGPATTQIPTTGSVPRSAVKVPAVWGNVPPRNPNFTGRVELLAELRKRLTEGTTAVLPEALHGMGGVGKTQVVIEYVYRNSGDYDVVWWIPSERPAQVASSMFALAGKLGLDVSETGTVVPAVKEALRVGTPYAKWLLIFDNADIPDDVRPNFPQGGPGHIVVTSRNNQWASVAKALEVDVFRRDESQSLLTRRAPTLSPAESDALAEVLGDLPLAIEQAAAWLAETGMQAQEYLSLFEEKKIELMEISPPVDYQLPVAAAWNVSLDHLNRTRPAALRLLQLCAFLAPEPISRSLLAVSQGIRLSPDLATVLKDPIQLGRAIREINRYALARIDHAKNTIQMHRLVQAVLIERMTPEERVAMRHSAHQLLAANNPQQPDDRDRWAVYAELYPHLVASQAITDAEEDWVRDLVIGEAKYHMLWGNPTESLAISQRAYDAWRETLGDSAPYTLEIGRWLGFTLFSVGRYQEAAELNARLLASYQETGDELPEALLEAMQAVASDRRVEGQFQESVELSRDVYDRCVQLFGDDDPLTLNAAHNLAVSLRLAGLFEAARQIDQDTWDRKVQVFGQNHEESIRAQRGVLIDRRQLGDYLASRDEFVRLAETYVESLGERDPQTVETNRSLSVTLRKAGQHERALRVSEDALRRYEQAFGPDNPGTMSAALNLSLDLRQAGRLEEAETVATVNFQRFRDALGKTHPHSLAAGGNLAIILRLKGAIQQARDINEATLERLRSRLGPDHVLTLSCATNLASDIFAIGDPETAQHMDNENLERYRSALGPDHPSTLAAALNLAIDQRELGRTDEAYALHDETLVRYRQVLGPDHPATRDATQWERANCDMDPMPL
jgi:tetratricopeptide (TPR) repeat protein